MDRITKHQCPSCGGSLIIDNDKQLYHCTFCGSTYDYEYFREEQMHEMGETFLSRGEFMAAIDAYKFTLQKDPHDFLALRGLMFAAAKMTGVEDVVRINETEEFSYNSQLVSEVIESAYGEDKEYFHDLRNIYNGKKKLVDCEKEIEDLKKEKIKLNDTISKSSHMLEEIKFVDKYGMRHSPKSVFIFVSVIDAFFLFLTLCFALAGGSSLLAADLVFAAVVAVISVLDFAVIFPRFKQENGLKKSIQMLYAESAELEKKIRDLESEEGKIKASTNASCHFFLKKDRQIMSGNDPD